MVQNSDPLFQEIDAAVQHDRMVAMWKQYRTPILIAAMAIVLFTLGLSQWRHYQEQLGGAALQQFTVATQQFSVGKYDDAAKDFAAIAEHPRSAEVADMAHLWQARALIANKQNAASLPILQALAEHPQSKQRVWSDLACLRLASLDAKQATTCLSATDDTPLAAERKLSNAAALWDAGKPDAARAILTSLTLDPLVNQSVHERAQALLSVLPPTPIAHAPKAVEAKH